MTMPATPTTPPAAPATPAPATPAPTTPAALTPEQAVTAVEGTPTPPPVVVPPPVAVPGTPVSPATPAPMTPAEFEALAKSDREKWQAQQEARAATARVIELEAQARTWADDPIAAFEAAGGSLDAYTQRVIDGGQPSPADGIARLEKTIAQQQEQISQLVNTGQETQQSTYYTQFAGEVQGVIGQGEDYQETRDAMAAMEEIQGKRIDMASDIRPHMDTHYKTTGKQLTPGEIAGTLRMKASDMAERIRKSPAIRRIMGLPPEPTLTPPPPGTPAVPAAPPPPGQPQPTLTSGTETGSPPEDLASLPHEERIRRVVAKQENPHWTPPRE